MNPTKRRETFTGSADNQIAQDKNNDASDTARRLLFRVPLYPVGRIARICSGGLEHECREGR